MDLLPDGYDIRPLSENDAPALADAQQRNRDHLAPWSPRRSDAFYTLEGQQAELSHHLESIEAGRLASHLLVSEGRIIGRVNLSNIVRGAWQSTNLGYWVDRDQQGKGLATAAVEYSCARAREIGLHRVEASTLVHNEASQRVLRKCGFTFYGTATGYLFIDGGWRHHNLYQRILHADPLDLA